ncbi:MAG TPA: DnaA N-terminal domain-containing protein, partial [Saprospiraceae bacterium]|nr:DnaA N-terminal domain-containing protein [Saprospiraceae bacterium]
MSQFEQELPPQQFNTWIRPLRLEGEDDFAHGLRLLAPNGFILKWVKERYLARIEALGSEYFAVPVNISLTLGTRAAAPPNAATDPPGKTITAQAATSAAATAKNTSALERERSNY